MLHPYNAHLEIEQKRMWKEMLETKGVDDERYEQIKQAWFLLCERMMLNIEAHESKEHIDQMWTNSREIEQGIVDESVGY